MRLVGDQIELDADGQVARHPRRALLDVLAQRQRVAAGSHGDRQADRRLAVVAEHGLRRIDIAALDLGDVAQPEEAVVGAEVDGFEAVFRREAAGDANGDALRPRLHDPARHYGVLRLQRLHHGADVDAERRHLLGGELQIDLLVLHTDEIDLGDVAHAQHLGAHALGIVAQLAPREAVRRQRVDDGIGVAELVVEEGPVDARGQALADVADLLAHLIPEVRHLGCAHAVLEIDEHHGLAGLGVAAHEVEMRHLLELLFDAVGDLVDGLGGVGAGPQRLDHHGLDGEGRVLLAAQLVVGHDARDRRRQHEVDDEAFVAQGPVGQIEGGHLAAASARRTFCPSRKRLTPAVTTISPLARPLLRMTRSVS